MSTPTLHDDDRPSVFEDDPLFSTIVKIQFGGYTFHGHKDVLCAKSRYMEKAINGAFKEAQTGIVDLGDNDNPECVRVMLRTAYGLDLIETKNKMSAIRTTFFVDLFTTADKYDFPEARRLAAGLFTMRIVETMQIETAEVVEAINYVLEHEWADKQLLNATMVAAARSLPYLRRNTGFQTMLAEVPGLAADLLTDMIDNMYEADEEDRTLLRCPICRHIEEESEEEQSEIDWACSKCSNTASGSTDWQVGRFWCRDLAGKTFFDPAP